MEENYPKITQIEIALEEVWDFSEKIGAAMTVLLKALAECPKTCTKDKHDPPRGKVALLSMGVHPHDVRDLLEALETFRSKAQPAISDFWDKIATKQEQEAGSDFDWHRFIEPKADGSISVDDQFRKRKP